MVSVIITKSGAEFKQVSLDGHAGDVEAGQNIVCAAVSVLAINTFNSIERFTDDAFTVDAAEEGGHLVMTFPEPLSDKSKLLLDSMLLGLDEIQKQYGDEYISLQYKEV